MDSEIVSTRRLTTRLVDDLLSGLSVLLTGLPNSGRSHLASLVQRELNFMGANVVSLRGNRMLADRPLSVLSLANTVTENGGKASAGSILNQAASSFALQVDRPNSVLIVDDAGGLDRVSAGLLAEVRAAKKTPMLLVGDYGVYHGELLTELIAAAQPGITQALTGMSFEDITQMTNALLGGIVGADVISRIAILSGGLPGLIHAIVQSGKRSGKLVKQDDVWLASDDLWDGALQFSLLPFLRGLSQSDLDCLVRLACADGMTRQKADELIGVECVGHFTRRGLLRLDQMSPVAGVHVFPSALAEMLRRGIGVPESGSGRETMATVEAGKWPVTLTGPGAAAIVDRIHTQWHAEVSRNWLRWNDDRTSENAIPLLNAFLSGAADDEKIATIFKKTRSGSNPDAYTEFVILKAVYRAIWERDLAGALSDLDSHQQAYPHLEPYLRGIKAHLILTCDRVPDAAVLAPPVGTGEGQDMLRLARAEAFIAQGRVQDAAEELALIAPLDKRIVTMQETLESLVLVLGDDVAAGVEIAVKRLRDSVVALDAHSISGHAYVAVLGMCMLGRFDELESAVEIIYRLGDANVFQSRYKAGLFMLGSFVADWEGRSDYSTNLVLQARSLAVGSGPFPGMMADRDSLLTAAASPSDLWEEVDELVSRGYTAAAIFLAIVAAELDPASARRAAPLIEIGTTSQSAVVRALTDYVDTIASGDVDRFERTVKHLREACGPLDATRATITWALMLRERGDLAGSLERAEAAWAESRRVTRPCEGQFGRLAAAVDLTAREVEVARYVSRGLSSVDIAAKIGIATRTIEAHLHSVYRKTGVNSREELRQITRTWLSLRG